MIHSLIRSLVLSLSIFTALSSFTAHAAIYGEDERKNISEEHYADWKKAARAVAVMVKASKVKFSGTEALIETKPAHLLQKSYNVCSDERYLEEPTHGVCTGFLISSDLIMTARHCIPSITACADYYWMFDYTDLSLDRDGNVHLDRKDVYECKEIVKHSSSRTLKKDYAVFRVTRKVTGRTPLKLDESFSSRVGDRVGMIGAPLGLPLKTAKVGKILDMADHLSFQVNVDTFGGNSGSPVFDMNTMKVLGILVAGEPDFSMSRQDKCNRPRHYYSERWKGERSYRVDAVEVQNELGLNFSSEISGE